MGSHEQNRRIFAIGLIIIEVIIIIIYGIFVRTSIHQDDSLNLNYYSMYQDTNVMMLVGFGFLMTSIKNNSWSALSYTFFLNAILVQLFFLLENFWIDVFDGTWEGTIEIVERSFIKASYSVASVHIGLGAVLGRVGPLEILIMGVVQIIGYTMNRVLLQNVIGIFDAGGSAAVHTFGAYFGLTVSFIIGRKVSAIAKPETGYTSNMFSMIGTLFLWMYWPSCNAANFASTPYQKSLIISNTIFSLTGSCIGTFIMTALIRDKFKMEDILNASLAGGVVIGSACSLLVNPTGALLMGLTGGILSTLCFKHLSQKIQGLTGLQDSCGTHNLHGIPGILGCIFGAIAIAFYQSTPLTNPTQIANLPFYEIVRTTSSFYKQGGIQIASLFISIGHGIIFGIIAGFLIRQIYVFESIDFFRDDVYFEVVKDGELHHFTNSLAKKTTIQDFSATKLNTQI